MLKVLHRLKEYTFINWKDFIDSVLHGNDFVDVFSYRLQGQIYDLHTPVDDVIIELVENDMSVIRHTAAHVLAHSLQRIYGDVLFGIGPVTDSGFFYDICVNKSIENIQKDMSRIIQEMNNIIDSHIPLIKSFINRDEFIIKNKDVIKNYIAKNIIEDKVLSLYTQADFYDLCKGPHLLHTGMLKNKIIKCNEVSQVEWHEFKMIRITFDLFNNVDEMENYYKQFEDMCSRDHRVLFQNMEICSFPEECSGMVLWHPNGLLVLNNLRKVIANIFSKDYQNIITPPVCKNTLWKKTGHLDKYSELMFMLYDKDLKPIESFKPMNCPEHTIFFKSKIRSYKDLPFRIFEFGDVFRNEHAGGLQGCKRLRNFTQDDGHIFCTFDHCKDEIVKFLHGAFKIYKLCGFVSMKIVIATRPSESIGTDDEWHRGIEVLRTSVESMNLSYDVDVGGGAFYGPKIEIHVKDNRGKFWQCGTIQIDFFLAQNLDAFFMNSRDEREFPVVLHRAAVGSLQRFLAITTEHNNGLPLTLHFCQVRILPVSMRSEFMHDVCINIKNYLLSNGIVADICHEESISKRIKIANKYKIPYICVIGEQELSSNKNLTPDHYILSIRFNNIQTTMMLKDLVKDIIANV